MTKNYFTDAQVIELTGKSLPNTKDMKLTKKCLGEFKALMNLAVEAAIGEPVGGICGKEKHGYPMAAFNTLDLNVGDILHSVKELDN